MSENFGVVSQTAPSLFRRIVDFPLSRLLLEVALIGVPLLFARDVAMGIAASQKNAAVDLGAALLVAVAGCLWYVAYARVIAQRNATELPLRGGFRGLGLGVLLGCGLIAAVALLLVLMGGLSIAASGNVSAAVTGLAYALVAGVVEEILLRGIVFRNLEDLCGSWFAIAFSAALFGALHLANPHASLAGALAIALQAGILLAAVYMATRSLWWVIGIHAGWNFAEGGLLGVRVSGTEVHGLFLSTPTGPEWLSGGEFGIEASPVATIVCLLVAIFFLRKARRDRQFIAPLWRRRGN